MILCQSCYARFERSPTLPPETPAVHCPACAGLPKPDRTDRLALQGTLAGVNSERLAAERRRRRKVETILHEALT